MANSIPGTTLKRTEETEETMLNALIPFLNMTGGLMLSQLCELTGLESAAIQNWVKRGFVSSPVSKRYSKEQVARILLINSLRDAMKLDNIAKLLSYINGNLLSSEDDIITDSELYGHFCRVVFNLEKIETINDEAIVSNVDKTLGNYTGQGKEKLKTALIIMVLMYESAVVKNKAVKLLCNIGIK